MTMKSVHPDLLRAFVTVADTASFTGAARLLGLRQSTVSQQVKRLEGITVARYAQGRADGRRRGVHRPSRSSGSGTTAVGCIMTKSLCISGKVAAATPLLHVLRRLRH